jgi:hypothetical protein
VEAFTNGKVSADARKAYVETNPRMADAFTLVNSPHYGYRMIAWESQIAMARACGRGVASGKGRSVHPYDELAPASTTADSVREEALDDA